MEAHSRNAGTIKAVAEATQKQKELADAGGLQKIGFSPEVAASMSATLAKQDEMNKQIDQGTDALKRWNTQAETAYARNLELVKQTAIDTKDYFSFLAASFEQGATAGHSMFEDLDTLAKNTANNMRTAFSDIFFATLQGNMKDAQAAFKNFFLSILREITNLMASQAVKGFLGLFGIKVTGGQLDLSGQSLAAAEVRSASRAGSGHRISRARWAIQVADQQRRVCGW